MTIKEHVEWYERMINDFKALGDFENAYMFHCLLFDFENGTRFFFKEKIVKITELNPETDTWSDRFPLFVKRPEQRDDAREEWLVKKLSEALVGDKSGD